MMTSQWPKANRLDCKAADADLTEDSEGTIGKRLIHRLKSLGPAFCVSFSFTHMLGRLLMVIAAPDPHDPCREKKIQGHQTGTN